MNDLASASYKENLELVWIHYSSHGKYTTDISGDEPDRRDECLVPSDFLTSGLIPDDDLHDILKLFNPVTKVIAVFDTCYPGTLLDLQFVYKTSMDYKTVENRQCPLVGQKVIALSACTDSQTSADADNIMGDNQYTGALSGCLLVALQGEGKVYSNVFNLLHVVKRELVKRGYSAQSPTLSNTYDLKTDPTLVPPPKAKANQTGKK